MILSQKQKYISNRKNSNITKNVEKYHKKSEFNHEKYKRLNSLFFGMNIKTVGNDSLLKYLCENAGNKEIIASNFAILHKFPVEHSDSKQINVLGGKK